MQLLLSVDRALDQRLTRGGEVHRRQRLVAGLGQLGRGGRAHAAEDADVALQLHHRVVQLAAQQLAFEHALLGGLQVGFQLLNAGLW